MTSRSSITTNDDLLTNEHAGDILAAEFIEPSNLTIEEVAHKIAASPDKLIAVISGASPIDAELDLRLCRYFGMSEGFFLRLQNRHDIVAAKRLLKDDLDRILPRAA